MDGFRRLGPSCLVDRESPRQSRPARPAPAQYGCRRAREIAGIIIPTRSMIIKNSAIFQPQATGAIAAMATPNAIMQTRTSASLPRLMRACSRSPRNMLWRGWDGVLWSANAPVPFTPRSVKRAHRWRSGAIQPIDAINLWRCRRECAPPSQREANLSAVGARIGSLPTINSNMVPVDAPYESSTPRSITLTV